MRRVQHSGGEGHGARSGAKTTARRNHSIALKKNFLSSSPKSCESGFELEAEKDTANGKKDTLR